MLTCGAWAKLSRPSCCRGAVGVSAPHAYRTIAPTASSWVLWEDGTVALDVVRTTRRHRLYTMGSLFARGTEFRNGLMKTVLDPEFAAP